ncbi:DUF763 domain-containing protein [Candidatus Woesearchaeota archaeon]|nr:MAG: DUF763 domain-containing protein [Candidatus Woesearchaeota archaeon]
MKTGTANLPLHGGKCPLWLFKRMKKLAGIISKIIIEEHGTEEYLKRLSDPFFFQSFVCTTGMDWHSSGTTTTLCGAIKESLNTLNLGLKVAGGKGKASRKTLIEIEKYGEDLNLTDNKIKRLIYSSRLSAKVDNSLIQDEFQLYHHCFILSDKGKWAVIQQGKSDRYARRYHWLSDNLTSFVEEPHTAICSDKKKILALDMTAKQSREARKASVDLIKENPVHLNKYFKSKQLSLTDFFSDKRHLNMQKDHYIKDMDKINKITLKQAYEFQPANYEELLSLRGVGPKTIRALALIAELIYGTKASWCDPAKYSFAHGGKDGVPYPADKKLIDNNIHFLMKVIRDSELDRKDRLIVLRQLAKKIRIKI